MQGAGGAQMIWVDSTAGANVKWVDFLNAAGVSSFRQVSDDGTALNKTFIGFNNSSGNVGIGTTTTPSLLTVAGLINMKNYTVATLPAGTRGDIAYVTDALLPSFLTTVAGGGAVVTPVFFDGSTWKSF